MVKRLTPIIVITLFAVTGAFAESQDKEWARFDGIWATSRGQMALWQAEDAVWGYYGEYGEIGGHVTSDGIFDFVWDEGVDGHGSGWLRLSADGLSFDGEWIQDIEIGNQGSWHGDYLGPNTFQVGDRAALAWKPGQPQESAQEEPVAEAPSSESPVEEPAEEPQPAPQSSVEDFAAAWTGTWETNRGTLVISVSGNAVTGTYGESGTVEGTVNKASLSGTWTETTPEGTVTSGEFVFWLDADGTSFRGTYDLASQPDIWLVWSGTKSAG